MSYYPERIAVKINIVLFYLLWTFLKQCSFSAVNAKKKTTTMHLFLLSDILCDSLDNNDGEGILKKFCTFSIFIICSRFLLIHLLFPILYWIFMFSGILTVFGWFMLKDPYTLSWSVMMAAITAMILILKSVLVCTYNYVGLLPKRSYKRD